jgi:hypothetical protein
MRQQPMLNSAAVAAAAPRRPPRYQAAISANAADWPPSWLLSRDCSRGIGLRLQPLLEPGGHEFLCDQIALLL